MRTLAFSIGLMALLSACAPKKPAAPQTPRSMSSSPRLNATVITVHTRIGPKPAAWTHQVAIASDRMRIGDELDQWRLFDLRNDAVTWVDDVQKTYRTVPGAVLRREALAASQLPLPPGIKEAQWANSGAHRSIAGVDSSQYVIRAGGYERQLWIGAVHDVPSRFLSLWLATESNRGPYSGLMKRVLPPLLGMSGFVMLESAEMPVANGRLAVEKIVTSIRQQPIPAVWLSIPAGYKNVSQPLKGSGAGRPPAASLRSGQNTRAVESQPSATTRTTP